MSLNVTNCQTLIRSFGAESNDWIDKEIELYLGEVEFEGEMKQTILVRVISAEVEHKKAVTPPPKKKKGGDMDEEIPFVLAFLIFSAATWLVAGGGTLVA